MKKAALVMAVALMAATILATPVMAIGPWEAFEVGNNKNLSTLLLVALGNTRGGAGGSIYWVWVESDQQWSRWQYQDAGEAKGLMNKAIVAQYSGPPTGMSAYFLSLGGDEYNNMWIYLSGDGGTNPSQYMGHGMIYWFVFGVAMAAGANAAQAGAIASGIAANYPAGEFWKHDNIFAPAP